MLTYHNADNPSQVAGELLTKNIKEQGSRPVLLMLSAGSAFSMLPHVDIERLKPDHLTITVLDERWSRDSAVNNFAQLSQTAFFKELIARRAGYIATTVFENEPLAQLALRFDESLQTWVKENQDGVIVITQGIGTDGHTAGILPYPESEEAFAKLFIASERWVVGYQALPGSTPYPQRVTVTIPFLKNRVDYALVFAVGSEKKPIIERLAKVQAPLHEFPAQALYAMRRVDLVSDCNVDGFAATI